MLNRRWLTLALVFAPQVALAARAAVLSPEDRALVEAAAGYLQGLTQAKGRFVQTDARGTVTRGEVYLKRPGRARFAYDPPSGLLVVADGTYVSVVNPQLKTFDRYPLMATPLSLFLARQIHLDKGVIITGVRRAADGFTLTAQDGARTAEGRISLIFSNAPLALIGWQVSDAQGQTTRIQLNDFAPTSGLAADLFLLKDPRPVRPGRAGM
ncbi:MAG: hypothetical protein CGW95_12925 [Phenylobacterium zucineum]|nr:MAG: hypothetical protein CGW95_12925 [Phenylobacterium zucineum]